MDDNGPELLRHPAMARGAISAAILILAGAPTSSADIILVGDQAAVAQCERIGEVRGSSALGGMLTNMAYRRALAQLKARARAAGATHILVVDISSGFAGSNMIGQAYRCPAMPPSGPAPN